MEIKDVEDLASLARIELPDSEKAQFLKDIKGILAYVDQIKEAEVGEVNTESEVRNAWREDAEEPREFSKEIITEQFPDSQDGFLKVKKIL